MDSAEYSGVSLTEKVYLVDHHRIGRQLGRSVPRAAFAGATLDHLFTGDGLEGLDPTTQDRVVAFNRDFLDCDCRSNPYCGHPEEKFARWLLDERLDGRDPEALIDAMRDAYGLYVYRGDLISFLDDAIRRLEALADLAAVEGAESYATEVETVRRGLESGRQPSR